MKYKTSSDLKRFALLKLRLQRENSKKPVNKQASREQIDNYSREAVRKGIVNDSGEIVEVNDEFLPK